MGINSNGIPFATQNPFERPGPAPDLEDGLSQTEQFTTIDEADANDAKLRLLRCSRDHRELVEQESLPLEQRREDELVLAREEADRRKRDFDERESLMNTRIAAWQRYAMPVGELVEKSGRNVVWAMLAVEAPLAFVAGYSLLGGVTTGDSLIDGPLKLAPLGLAVGVAFVCALATLFAGRTFSAYFEHRRALEIYRRESAICHDEDEQEEEDRDG